MQVNNANIKWFFNVKIGGNLILEDKIQVAFLQSYTINPGVKIFRIRLLKGWNVVIMWN